MEYNLEVITEGVVSHEYPTRVTREMTKLHEVVITNKVVRNIDNIVAIVHEDAIPRKVDQLALLVFVLVVVEFRNGDDVRSLFGPIPDQILVIRDTHVRYAIED